MLPLRFEEEELPFKKEDYLFLPDIRRSIEEKKEKITAFLVKDGSLSEVTLILDPLTEDERSIIQKGCLINYYRG